MVVCPRCGTAVSPDDLFCENCGCPLSGAAAEGGASAVRTCLCPPGQSKPDEDGYCQVCGLRCVSEKEALRKHIEVAVDERLAVVSDIGRRHPSNEDAGAVVRGPGDSVILVVADGVSTAINSASAAQAAVEAALGVLSSWSGEATSTDAVRSAIEAANQAVLALPFKPSGGEDGPETTIVVALCRGGRVALGWAGDSRAYLIGFATEEILTVDDSWVEAVVRSGEMQRQQAEADKRAHYVTQVLGMRDQQLDEHMVEREVSSNCVLLLCSDGLWNYFEREGELAEAVRQHNDGDALSLCQWLVDQANERGGHDNVTVAVLTTSDTGFAGAPGEQASSMLAESVAQSTPPDGTPSPPAGTAQLASGAIAPLRAASAGTPIQARGR
jgi:PPM family protein phosphatase